MIRHSILSILMLAFLSSTAALADVIRLKSGSMIRGQVIRFDGKEFTVVLEGTQSRAIINLNDVQSIDFDEAASSTPVGDTRPIIREDIPVSEPSKNPPAGFPPPPAPGPAVPTPNASGSRETTVEVSAKEIWFDSGVDLKPGQMVKISASGSITIAPGRTSGPGGTELPDEEKLIPDRPTGALIGVIGDDNDDFFFIGVSKEFIAPREGRLFMMVNEGNLGNNAGSFTVHVQVGNPAVKSPRQ